MIRKIAEGLNNIKETSGKNDKVMDKLIEQGIKVDLTVTSPPYDNLRSYNGNNELWNESVWKQVVKKLYKITSDGGVVVWVVGDAVIKGSETGTSFKQAAEVIDRLSKKVEQIKEELPASDDPSHTLNTENK